jgi:hypothetical protein
LVQVAVAVPENPEALFVTEVLWLCVRALTGKVQEPLVKVVAGQGLVVGAQIATEYENVPLLHEAVMEPE